LIVVTLAPAVTFAQVLHVLPNLHHLRDGRGQLRRVVPHQRLQHLHASNQLPHGDQLLLAELVADGTRVKICLMDIHPRHVGVARGENLQELVVLEPGEADACIEVCA
jgi:hypothetical protein